MIQVERLVRAMKGAYAQVNDTDPVHRAVVVGPLHLRVQGAEQARVKPWVHDGDSG